MKKCFLIVGVLVAVGCSNETVVKNESVKWVSAGTLVSASPDTESTPHPGRVKTAVLGETTFNRTRVETSEGVYIVSDKIGVVETGAPVSVGYVSSDKYPDSPSYLTIRGERYKIVR
ncbi:MAG: hypothetical protein ACYSWP_22375 [Planctomycetota bacterium]|jgi:hypothetical protein